MKKLLSCLLVVAMMLTLVAAFAACGGEEKGTEAKTEAKTEGQTEAKTEGQTEAKTEEQTEAKTEGQTEAQTEAKTEAQTEGQTEAQTEQQSAPQTDASIPNSEEGKITFAKWDEEGWSPIFVIPESMYNTLIRDGEKYEIDGITWEGIDNYTIYITLVSIDGNEYNYGMTWEPFIQSWGATLTGDDEAALGFYTAKYDINGDGKDEYVAMMRNVGCFADPTYGGWVDNEVEITWDLEDGSSSEPITFLMVVTNPDFY